MKQTQLNLKRQQLLALIDQASRIAADIAGNTELDYPDNYLLAQHMLRHTGARYKTTYGLAWGSMYRIMRAAMEQASQMSLEERLINIYGAECVDGWRENDNMDNSCAHQHCACFQ